MQCGGKSVRRAVLDPGVLVSALISPGGPPASLLIQAQQGELDLVASAMVLEELEQVLLREKFRRYVDEETVRSYLALVRSIAQVAPDPDEPPPMKCSDPDDDYLIALAFSQNAALVSGDAHLLELAGKAPIFRPANYLEQR
ncbi:MAG TPA: putative toxin-antitoxin system toxin component, PIN family [Solirubrobacterales bacterium]|nr:putative toxin-antitoxin system toxin component, PIN family [Solirubrobacterales bacterium]